VVELEESRGAHVTPAIAVTVGILGAATLVLLARGAGPGRERLLLAVGLGVTGIAYLLFGLARGAPGDHLAHELLGAVLFCGAAVLGARGRPWLLALGWTAHVLWDLFFHYTHGPAFAPDWYAMFCVGFDLPVGGYVAGRIAGAAATHPGLR
jgi:hypothetical protein